MRTKEERQKDREERFQKLRERVKEARKGPLRPLDDDDREALNFVIETTKNARADGDISLIEIEAIAEAVQLLREARSNTP